MMFPDRYYYKVCEKGLRKVRSITHGGRGSLFPLRHAGGNASKPLLTPYDSIRKTSKRMIVTCLNKSRKALRKVRSISHGGRGSSLPLHHVGGNASKPLLIPYHSIRTESPLMFVS